MVRLITSHADRKLYTLLTSRFGYDHLLALRLGSCGALVDVKVGTVVVPSASIAVNRNYDYDFVNGGPVNQQPYRFSKRVRHTSFHGCVHDRSDDPSGAGRCGCRFANGSTSDGGMGWPELDMTYG